MALNPLGFTVQRLVRMRRRQRGPLRPSWDERFETMARYLHYYGMHAHRLPIGLQRRMLREVERSDAIDRMRFERVTAAGVPAHWFRGEGADASRVILYLHGGGYCIGSVGSHRDIIARLCLASGATALALDYRLAPEHPFPAQLDDALAAHRWLLAQGVDPARLVVAGDSAGGGLTISTLVALRDRGETLPAAAIVFSPWVDLEVTGASMRANIRYDYVSADTLRALARCFVGAGGNLRHPLAAPLHADLRGLPPLLVQAGGAETLLDDARRIAARARDAGVDVTLEIEPDMIHVWQSFAAILEPGRAALARAGAFVRAQTAGATAAHAPL
jgi:monoterpene epsilon-lactone hydrolase